MMIKLRPRGVTCTKLYSDSTVGEPEMIFLFSGQEAVSYQIAPLPGPS